MMHDKNDQQSAKDVLEDIKKMMHNNGYNKSSIISQKLDDEIPHLQYDNDEDDDESLDFGEEFETSDDVSEPLIDTANTEDRSIREQENRSLLSKENIDATSAEIQHLVEKVRQTRELPKVYSLTLEELAIKLLEPQLKEWLNNHLHNLIKEIVEREIKYITGK
ncbi:MAG: hypothetical protein sL5_04370 [Candidatus Mesenet longicola]|uniref:DUF2497 domain-containing protein n=1 Tax=Candidatus Mesenet longicola TaxID=1892558 RepID=A0A8J3HUW0_9RICK|nr:MAG: hypothetical protein sGL2_04480 [Candidatus Mesenet longicola]GHM59444.1 MAG: hypothetical protein sL5_04370 [Candidatus Mesenet longicola]